MPQPQTPILLPFSLWQSYTEFYLLWRKLGGQVLPTATCEVKGISRNVLGRLRQLGVIAYGQHTGAWWPVRGVTVQVEDVDGPKAIATAQPKHRGRSNRRRAHLQTRATESMGEQVERAAEAEGVTVSAWLRDAVQRKLEVD